MGTGLSPLYAVPAGIFAGIPIIHNQVLVLNEETQLVGCFAAFVITAYTQGGAAVAKMLDDKAQAIIEEHSASEDKSIREVEDLIAAHKTRLAALDDLSKMEQASTEYEAKAAALAPKILNHEVSTAVEKALASILGKEGAEKEKLSKQLARDAVLSVTESFNKDAKAVDTSTKHAIDVLMGTKSASGTHPIDASFVKFFKDTAAAAEVEIKKNEGKVVENAHSNQVMKDLVTQFIQKRM